MQTKNDAVCIVIYRTDEQKKAQKVSLPLLAVILLREDHIWICFFLNNCSVLIPARFRHFISMFCIGLFICLFVYLFICCYHRVGG